MVQIIERDVSCKKSSIARFKFRVIRKSRLNPRSTHHSLSQQPTANRKKPIANSQYQNNQQLNCLGASPIQCCNLYLSQDIPRRLKERFHIKIVIIIFMGRELSYLW